MEGSQETGNSGCFWLKLKGNGRMGWERDMLLLYTLILFDMHLFKYKRQL